MVSLEFFIGIIILAAPGIFPGGKGRLCVGLTTLPSSCADCLKIWEPQPPEIQRAKVKRSAVLFNKQAVLQTEE
jgi:hypothetical protein